MTREQVADFLDGLDDSGLTRVISELMWFQVTRGSLQKNPGLGHALEVQRIMCNAAREHVIDRLTGEPETDPLPGRA